MSWQLGLWRIWFSSISRSARCYPTAHEANFTYFSIITSSLSQLTWTSRQTWSLDNHLEDLTNEMRQRSFVFKCLRSPVQAVYPARQKSFLELHLGPLHCKWCFRVSLFLHELHARAKISEERLLALPKSNPVALLFFDMIDLDHTYSCQTILRTLSSHWTFWNPCTHQASQSIRWRLPRAILGYPARLWFTRWP